MSDISMSGPSMFLYLFVIFVLSFKWQIHFHFEYPKSHNIAQALGYEIWHPPGKQ